MENYAHLTALHLAAPGDGRTPHAGRSAAVLAALHTNRGEPFPCRRRARILECGDLSPLLRKRLVAVELPLGSDRAAAPALARAVNAPFLADASRNLTATSRRKKAVTSHRTPQSLSVVGNRGSKPTATFNRRSATIHWVLLRSASRAGQALHTQEPRRAPGRGRLRDTGRQRPPEAPDFCDFTERSRIISRGSLASPQSSKHMLYACATGLR